MKVVIKIVFILVLFQFSLMSSGVSAEETHKRESCRVCGMYIDEYIKSAAELVYPDGRKEYSCGVACMLRIVEDEGGLSAFKSVKVHDWVSGKLVDAETATYVIGSQVIPDMVPNYIAFAKREEAEAFMAKEGGEIMDFKFAYRDISEVGTTTPFRIRTAVTPGAGNFAVGMVYGYQQKDNLKIGSNSRDPSTFINENGAQAKVPKELQVQQQSLTFNYSPTDNIALFANLPWFEKRSTSLQRPTGNTNNAAIQEKVENTNGFGDISLEGRYNFWHTTRWDKFATILLGTSLPTGQFNFKDTGFEPAAGPNRQAALIGQSIPGLQLGKGTATFTGGLLYSQRWKELWLHTQVMYNANPENNDQYAFGDVLNGGVALHYTPNYDLMVGIEIDASNTAKNKYMGNNVGNTGGTVTNLAFVSDYRFMNAFGGNFKLRSSIGLPIYEDMNYKKAQLTGTNQLTQVQLGDGYFANVFVIWTFRSAPDY